MAMVKFCLPQCLGGGQGCGTCASGKAASATAQHDPEASFAVQARAVKDYFNLYDPHSLAFKEGDIITVLEQRGDGQWKGYVVQEGRMAKTGVFPANHVVLVDGQALKQQQQLRMKGGAVVPDLLSRGPHLSHNGHLHNGFGLGSDTTSLSSSSTDDSYPPPSPHLTSVLGPPPPSAYTSYGGPPPPPSAYTSYGGPPPLSPGGPAPQSPAHIGYGGSPGLGPYGVPPPSSPGYHSAGPGPYSSALGGGGGPPASPGGYLSSSPAGPFGHHRDIHDNSYSSHSPGLGPQHSQFIVSRAGPGDQHHGGEWPGPGGAGLVAGGGGDMRGVSPGKEHVQPCHSHSPAHSNRNSAASSDSGRGVSTGHLEPKVVTVSVLGQHRLSDQSYESGVSSRQSYHSTSSSSLGSLDRLEESPHCSAINVQQLLTAGVPDKEVLHAWLHDLRFEDYYPLFLQAGYDMPTISRMTPEDLTAIGITKPAHRKRLKAEIARLHIHDGIPDFCPHDLIEWLHLLGLGMYHETLAGQGYGHMDCVPDITWEDLEEIGIKKLGHQKKIMLAVDRLKRITSASKRLSSVEPRRPSLDLLEPPPPAPPIGRWSGEVSALPPHMYEGGLGVGAKPKRSPSGDSISTVGSGGSGGSGEMRTIPLPREDAGLSAGPPVLRQASITSASSAHSDVVAIQVKRQGRSSTSEEAREGGGPLYQSFQGPGKGGPPDFPAIQAMSTSDPGVGGMQMAPRMQPKPVAKITAKARQSSRENSPEAEMEKHECENNSDGKKAGPALSASEQGTEGHRGGGAHRGGGPLRVEIRENIYDQPQVSPNSANAPASPKPQLGPKPASPLHVATHHSPAVASSGSPTGRNKKTPPPPPKRTHSIRCESSLPPVSEVTPPSFSVTTTATVGSAISSMTSINNAKNASHVPGSVGTTAPSPTAGRPENSATEKTQPQTEAFASCVKSLSQRFGSKKSEMEGSQESLSSDSDEFPPPPPPIAMDIITPKIRNYGIPSKADLHHSPLHAREYGHHGHHAPPHKDYAVSLHSRLKTLQTSEGGSPRHDPHSLSAAGAPLRRISPGRDMPASSISQHAARDPDWAPLGDNRSESTASFETTASTASLDSNTLPFANENVGTIKQRAAAMKPSIVQTEDVGDGERTVDLNTALFDRREQSSVGEVHRTSGGGASSGGEGAQTTSGVQTNSGGGAQTVGGDSGHKPVSGAGAVSEGVDRTPGQSVADRSQAQCVASGGAAPSVGAKVSQSNHGACSEGPQRPPLPDKKPSLVAASQAQQQQQKQNASNAAQQDQSVGQPETQPKPQAPETVIHTQPMELPDSLDDEGAPRQSSDVLSDIDNMLQGLTDELDAMLLEEIDS
ncbi:hypothetical protein ACOMHN_060415 [Nucella lapillus]